ncbi:MAG: hypothetical protein GY724_17750, partial [Actinomycetia bacterium]|nr:hypothetical protein [Actinomycetes bacterium]
MTADNPNPEDGATDVTPLVVLGWEPATPAATRDVYLGTSWEGVNSASADNPLDVLVSPGQEAITYDPGRLALDTTYYWRIDEVNGTADQTVFRGDIWSFTVEPVSYALPIGSVNATASSMDPSQEVANTVNGSGLSTEDRHGTGLETMWIAEATDAMPWIQFTLNQVHKLDKVHVWNHNTQSET